MLGFIVFVLCVLVWLPFLWLVGRAINYALLIKEEELPPQKWGKAIFKGVAGMVVLIGILTFFEYWTDWLWFKEVGYLEVFTTKILTQILTFFIPAIVAFPFFWLNMKLFFEFVPSIPAIEDRYHEKWRKRDKIVKLVTVILAVVIAFIFGLATFSWQEVLLFLNSSPTGKTDPIFQKDISFYLFTWPVLKSLIGLVLFVVALAFVEILCLGFYVMARVDQVNSEKEKEKGENLLSRYLSVLAGIFLFTLAFGIYFWRYSLLFGDHGVFYGAGYAAVEACLPMLNVMMVIFAIDGVLTIVAGFLKKWKFALINAGSTVILVVVLLVIYPGVVQHFSVKPEELDKETPYIEHNIGMTRKAYGLDRVEAKRFEPNDKLGLADFAEEKVTLENVRLWDWRALAATYKQTQEIRQYYEFSDLDIDRYTINGQYRAVMISPRELPVSQLAEDSQTWVNTRLKYTHGFGVVLSPVNEFTPEGMPHYYIKDIPPQSLAEVKLTQPQIYFGEMAESHIFVKTTTEEFDYPSGEKNVFTKYDGKAGIPLDSFWRKLAFAWKFDGMAILLSDYLNEKSKVIFRRNIVERVKAIAPFLQFDEDPYFVISESGETIWIIDAYTISGNYPYSKPVGEINYIRNSVKVVVETKSGFVNFYIFDETDPILKTWKAIFPDMFLPKSQMHKELLSHIRYPEDMFRVQAKILATYHMTNPQIFYNREDLWEIAKEPMPIGGKTTKIVKKGEKEIEVPATPEDMQSYYTIIKLPGEEREEFLQMLPFTPATKQNMIAWLAGRCDSDDYGKLLLYQFPKDRLVFGPMQVAARMNQDKEMSGQLTLWNQQGSEVNIENILVIPVKNAILYVIPVYLQAQQSKMPELKKVVISYGDKIVWGDSFDEALAKVFGEKVKARKEVTAEVTSAVAGSENELLKGAKTHYENYLKLTSEGKHAEAGKALEELGKILNQF